jgi:hypothetical protein
MPPKSGKPSSKSAPKPKTVNKDKESESVRFEMVMNALSHKSKIITAFPELTTRKLPDHIYDALYNYVLETIQYFKETECTGKKASADRYPEDKFVLLKDRLLVVKASKKGKVTKTPNTIPKKSIIKRESDEDADDANDDTKDEDTNDDTKDHDEDEPTVDEPTVDEPTVEETKEVVKVKKSNIMQSNKNTRAWLQFILNRFVHEITNLPAKKVTDNIKSEAEYVKTVLDNKSLVTCFNKTSSLLSHSVITTVLRLGDTVDFIKNNYKLDTLVTQAIQDEFNKGNLSTYVSYTVNFIVKYFKLLGFSLGTSLWCASKSVTTKLLENEMRVLEMGNKEFIKHENYYGITNGLFIDLRTFDDSINPPVVKDESKKRGKKTKVEDTKEEPKKGPKKEETKKVPAKKEVVEEPEDEEEPEEEPEEPEEPVKKPAPKTTVKKTTVKKVSE